MCSILYSNKVSVNGSKSAIKVRVTKRARVRAISNQVNVDKTILRIKEKKQGQYRNNNNYDQDLVELDT